MTRVRTVLFVALMALALGLATSRAIFFTVFYVIAIVLIVTYVWSRNALSRVQLVRQTRARRAQVGGTLSEPFTLRNRSPIPNMWLEMSDESDMPGHHASHAVTSMPARTEYSWTVRTICQERGRFRLGPILLTRGDPFGLFRIKYQLAHTSNIVVYPNTVHLRSFPLPIDVLPGDAGRDVAMQVAAMKRIAVDKDGVDASVVEKEIEIGKEQARQEGKPEEMLEKIALGKLNKFLKENTLLAQAFVKATT